VADVGKERVAKRIELIANVGIAIVALLSVIQFVRSQLEHTKQPPHIAIGSKFKLKNVDWKASRKTLVLALSTNCHFCTESAPFYRELVKQAEAQGVRTIAVFPQSQEEAASYLAVKAVKVDSIHQLAFTDAQISATPTVLLVDENGEVKAVWVGKLPAAREKDLLARLGSR